MKKYCKFLHNIYDRDELVWQKGQQYEITYEDNENYYFGEDIQYGISKTHQKRYFTVIEE